MGSGSLAVRTFEASYDDRGGGQANITEADDADFGLGVTTHECVSLNRSQAGLAPVGKFYSNDDQADARRSAMRAAECPSPKGLWARAMAA